MRPHLFVFGYEGPADRQANERFGGDQESSSAVWIVAESAEQALTRGRVYAEEFVSGLYRDAGLHPSSWMAAGFVHWISREPLQEFAGIVLDMLPTIDGASIA